MGVLERSQWEQWARDWGLAHHPQRGNLIRDEWLVGARHGYLLRILSESPGQIIISLIFALVGAWYAFRFLKQPKFTPKIEQVK